MLYKGDLWRFIALLSFRVTNCRTVSNFLQESYSTFLTSYKRIACSAFSEALQLLLEYSKMFKFINMCIIPQRLLTCIISSCRTYRIGSITGRTLNNLSHFWSYLEGHTTLSLKILPYFLKTVDKHHIGNSWYPCSLWLIRSNLWQLYDRHE